MKTKEQQVEELVKNLNKQFSRLYEVNGHGSKAFLSPHIRKQMINIIRSHPDLALIDREKIDACIHYVEDAMGEQDWITKEEYIKQLPVIPLVDLKDK